MGAVGGGLWHYFKGLRNSPSGQKFKGGIEAVRGNAPRLGGSFAIWGALFSSFDCTLVFLRQKEDPWNSIASGALTAGVINLRNGLTPAAKSAAVGGVLLAMIEGLGIMISKMTSPPPPRTMASMHANMPPTPGPAPGSLPPYGGLPAGSMATAQSQFPSGEMPQIPAEQSESSEKQGWGSLFSWGKKKEESLDDSAYASPLPKEL